MPYIKSTYEYTKLRRNFGRQTLFQDVPAQILDSITPNKHEQKQYILRNPVNRFVQATLPQSESDANTKQMVTREQGVDHAEGGWPRDVHVNNEEHTLRYRRRIMHEENYINTVLNLSPIIQHYLHQNNAIEVYESYFQAMCTQEPIDKYSIRIANVFRDRHRRPVSCVEWTNDTNSMLAVAHSFRAYSSTIESNQDFSNDCYLWDVTRQTEPFYVFTPEYPCWQLACSPINPKIILGGLENGTVTIFDAREGANSVSTSSVYNSHRGPISSLLFTHSRTNTEFFSGSPDGQCMWWDFRDLSKPLDHLPMSIKVPAGKLPDLNNAEGVSSFEFDRGLPTKFLCGTESGLIINVNRMGKVHSEKLSSYWNAHIGPVRAVHRSTCTSRMFVSCGDSSVRVWSEEVRTAPIIVTNQYRYQVLDVAWAPLRYSSYMSICAGGYFYFWDFLRKYKEPIATLQIAKCELTKVTPHSEGHSVAIGDSEGSLHLLHLSDTLTIPGKRDKLLMFQKYERETRREHILDNRLKELRLKMKGEEEAIEISVEPFNKEEQLQAVEEEYFNIVNKELSLMESLVPSHSDLL